MSVIAVITVSAGTFSLGQTLQGEDDVRIRFLRVVPLGDRPLPYFWVSNGDLETVGRALRNEECAGFDVIGTTDGETLIRVDWNRIDGFLDVLVETGATVLDGDGGGSVWRFELLFEDHDRLAAFYRHCSDRDISVEVRSVHNPGVPQDADAWSDLTDEQREALRFALVEGYFDVPREITLEDLADEIGISGTAVSQRLRRGIATLLTTALVERRPRDESDR